VFAATPAENLKIAHHEIEMVFLRVSQVMNHTANHMMVYCTKMNTSVAECPQCGVKWRTRGIEDDQHLTCPFCGYEFTFHSVTQRTAVWARPNFSQMEETNPMGLQDGGGLGRMELPSHLLITLEIISGPQKGQILEITKSCMTLGRCFRDTDLVDTSISRRHAAIEIYGDRGILLRDLASINGTHVNEQLVAQARLKDGDVVRLGMTEFKFQVQSRSS
jgi:hypothetical protein